RFFSFSSSSAGKTGVVKTSTNRSSSRSTSREREAPPMSTPTGSEASQEKERDAPRLSSSSAISSLVERSVPLASSPAVTAAIRRGWGGARRPPPRSPRERATVGLKWFSRTKSWAPLERRRAATASPNGGRERRDAGEEDAVPLPLPSPLPWSPRPPVPWGE